MKKVINEMKHIDRIKHCTPETVLVVFNAIPRFEMSRAIAVEGLRVNPEIKDLIPSDLWESSIAYAINDKCEISDDTGYIGSIEFYVEACKQDAACINFVPKDKVQQVVDALLAEGTDVKDVIDKAIDNVKLHGKDVAKKAKVFAKSSVDLGIKGLNVLSEKLK